MAFSWTNSVPSSGSTINTNFILEAKNKEDTLHNRLCLAHNNADCSSNLAGYNSSLNSGQDSTLYGTVNSHNSGYLSSQYSTNRSHNSGLDNYYSSIKNSYCSFCSTQKDSYDGTLKSSNYSGFHDVNLIGVYGSV